jgi:WD40 repeat protein
VRGRIAGRGSVGDGCVAEEEGLSLTEFLRVMLRVLPVEMRTEEDRLQLAESLIETFKGVDVNGDRSMEWAELSSFIAEMGLASSLPSNTAPVRCSYRERMGFVDMTSRDEIRAVECVEWPPVAPPPSEAVKMTVSGGHMPKPQRPIEFWTVEDNSSVLRVWEAGRRPTVEDPDGGTRPPGLEAGEDDPRKDIAFILGMDPAAQDQQEASGRASTLRSGADATFLKDVTSMCPMQLKYQLDITTARLPVLMPNEKPKGDGNSGDASRAEGGGGAGKEGSRNADDGSAPKQVILCWKLIWDQKLLAISQSDCRITLWRLPPGGPPAPPPSIRPGAPLSSVESLGAFQSTRKRPENGGFTYFDSVITRGPATSMAYSRELLYAANSHGRGYVVAYHIPSLQVLHIWKPHSDIITSIVALSPRALGFSKRFDEEPATSSRRTGRSQVTVTSSRSQGVAGAPLETGAAGSAGMLLVASMNGTVACSSLAPSFEAVLADYQQRRRTKEAFGDVTETEAPSSPAEPPLDHSKRAGAALAALLGHGKRISVAETPVEDATGTKHFPPVPEVAKGPKLLQVLRAHQRGVRHLCYIASEGLLVTCGFDQDAKGFELPSGKHVLTLRGHRAPIISAREVWQGRTGMGLGGAGAHSAPRPQPPSLRRGTEEVQDGRTSSAVVFARCLTMDETACFRLWDVRRNPTGMAPCLVQFDTASVAPSALRGYQLTSFAASRWSGDIFAGGSQMHHFLPLAHASEANFPAIVQYSPVDHVFFVAGGGRAPSSSTVRVFNAANGAPKAVFYDMAGTSVTNLILDDRMRKLIVGTQEGSVSVHNASTGQFMKGVDKPHKSGHEVTGLRYVLGTKMLVSCAWDRTIRVFDEDPPHACVGMRSIARAHDADITCCDASNNLVLISSGDPLGFVKVWDFETLKLDGACVGHRGTIVDTKFLDPYPLLCVIDDDGQFVMWGMRGSSRSAMYQPVVAVRNLHRKESSDPALSHAGVDETRGSVALTCLELTYWPFDIDSHDRYGRSYREGDRSSDPEAVNQSLGIQGAIPTETGYEAPLISAAETSNPGGSFRDPQTGVVKPERGHGGARRVAVLTDEHGWVTVLDLTAMIERSGVNAFLRGAIVDDGDDATPRIDYRTDEGEKQARLASARRASINLTSGGAIEQDADGFFTAGTAAAARRLSVSHQTAIDDPKMTSIEATSVVNRLAAKAGVRDGHQPVPRRASVSGEEAVLVGRRRRRSLLQQAHEEASLAMGRPVGADLLQSPELVSMDLEAAELVGPTAQARAREARAKAAAAYMLQSTADAAARGGKKAMRQQRAIDVHLSSRGDGRGGSVDASGMVQVVGKKVLREVAHGMEPTTKPKFPVVPSAKPVPVPKDTMKSISQRARRRGSVLASGIDSDWDEAARLGAATKLATRPAVQVVVDDSDDDNVSVRAAAMRESPARRAASAEEADRVFFGLSQSSVHVPLIHTAVEEAISAVEQQQSEQYEKSLARERSRLARRQVSSSGSVVDGAGSVARPGSQVGSVARPGSHVGSVRTPSRGRPRMGMDTVDLEEAARQNVQTAEAIARRKWEEALDRHRAAVQKRMEHVDATDALWRKPLACWRAHPCSISSITVTLDPPSIVTCASDGSVRVWSLRGELIGVLIPSRRELALHRLGLSKPSPWIFSWDRARETRLKRLEAVTALRLMEEEEEERKHEEHKKQSLTSKLAGDALSLGKFLERGTIESSRQAAATLEDDDEVGEGFSSQLDLELAAIAAAISEQRRKLASAAVAAAATTEGSPPRVSLDLSRTVGEDAQGMKEAERRLLQRESGWAYEQLASSDAIKVLNARLAIAAARAGMASHVPCLAAGDPVLKEREPLLTFDGRTIGHEPVKDAFERSQNGGLTDSAFDVVLQAVGLGAELLSDTAARPKSRGASGPRINQQRAMSARAAVTVLRSILADDVASETAKRSPLWKGWMSRSTLGLPESIRRSLLLSDRTAMLLRDLTGASTAREEEAASPPTGSQPEPMEATSTSKLEAVPTSMNHSITSVPPLVVKLALPLKGGPSVGASVGGLSLDSDFSLRKQQQRLRATASVSTLAESLSEAVSREQLHGSTVKRTDGVALIQPMEPTRRMQNILNQMEENAENRASYDPDGKVDELPEDEEQPDQAKELDTDGADAPTGDEGLAPGWQDVQSSLQASEDDDEVADILAVMLGGRRADELLQAQIVTMHKTPVEARYKQLQELKAKARTGGAGVTGAAGLKLIKETSQRRAERLRSEKRDFADGKKRQLAASALGESAPVTGTGYVSFLEEWAKLPTLPGFEQPSAIAAPLAGEDTEESARPVSQDVGRTTSRLRGPQSQSLTELLRPSEFLVQRVGLSTLLGREQKLRRYVSGEVSKKHGHRFSRGISPSRGAVTRHETGHAERHVVGTTTLGRDTWPRGVAGILTTDSGILGFDTRISDSEIDDDGDRSEAPHHHQSVPGSLTHHQSGPVLPPLSSGRASTPRRAFGEREAMQLLRAPSLVTMKGRVSTASTLATMEIMGLAGAADLAGADISHPRRMKILELARSSQDASVLGSSASEAERSLFARARRRFHSLRVVQLAQGASKSSSLKEMNHIMSRRFDESELERPSVVSSAAVSSHPLLSGDGEITARGSKRLSARGPPKVLPPSTTPKGAPATKDNAPPSSSRLQSARSPSNAATASAMSEARKSGKRAPTVFHGSILASDVDEAAELFQRFDKDGSGEVDAKEFLDSGLWNGQGGMLMSGSLFNALDADGSGQISLEEYLRAVFASKLKSPEQLRDIVAYAMERGRRRVEKAAKELQQALGAGADPLPLGGAESADDGTGMTSKLTDDELDKVESMWKLCSGGKATIEFTDLLIGLLGPTVQMLGGKYFSAVAAKDVRVHRLTDKESQMLRQQVAGFEAVASSEGVDIDKPINQMEFTRLMERGVLARK